MPCIHITLATTVSMMKIDCYHGSPVIPRTCHLLV
jgi:hypothetical protein